MIKTYILIISTMILSLLIFNIVYNSCTKSFKNNKDNINNLIQHFTNGSSRGRWIGGIKILSNNVGDSSNGEKVSKFKLKYSRDNTNWFNVDNDDEFINSSDNDGNIYFNTPVYAKKIRLLPTECVNKCTIKFDYLEHSGKDASGANLSIPIDCKVSEWSDSSCSKTCGGGTLTKTRTIVRQPQNNGLSCPSDDENIREDVPCNQQTCAPEPCEISQWSEWSSCSKTCGGGTRTKTREITKQPKYNGAACPSDLEITGDCNIDPCPVDCVVDAWGNWSECNKFCGGGNKTRNKEIITQPAHGGTTCPPASELTESASCGTQDCVTSDQKRYVIQAGLGSNNTCKEKTDRYWGDVGNTANRNKVGFFELNVLGGAGNNINYEHNKSYYHATKLVRNGILNASGTCAEHGQVGCSVPDYGLTAQGRGILTDTSGTGSTLCKSESNHDLVKKATYFTTEECPSGWSQKLASKISFNVNKPNGEYNLCQADLSKQGAIDFFNTFEDNQFVLKYKDSCVPGNNEKLVWSGDNIKLCKYEVPPEPMYSVHFGSFDTIPSDYVPWQSSNDMVWLQQDAAQYAVPGMGKNYAFPLAGDAPEGGIFATVMVPRGPPPHNTRAGWGSSPRQYITKIRTTSYPCNWNARGLCTAAKGWYCCPTWVHPSYQYDSIFYGSNNERDDLKGTGKTPKGKKVDGWIYKNPSLFDKTTSQPKIDFHKIVNITPTTTFNNSGFNKWNLVKTRDQTWAGVTAVRVIYNIILSSQISALNQNTKIYLPYEFTNDGTSVKYAIGTITQNNRAGVVWDLAEIPVNEPFTITTNSKLIGLNPSFNKRFYFRLPGGRTWDDFVSLIR